MNRPHSLSAWEASTALTLRFLIALVGPPSSYGGIFLVDRLYNWPYTVSMYYIRNSKGEVVAATTSLDDAASILKSKAEAGETYTAEKVVVNNETQRK